MFSPDGRWIAFSSDRTGRREVFIAPFPEAEPVTAVSVDGGRSPVWNRDGSELYYRSGDDVFLASLHFKHVIEFGEPRPLEGLEGEGTTTPSRLSQLAANGLPGAAAQPPQVAMEEGEDGGWIRANPPSPGMRGQWRWRYCYVRNQKRFVVELREAVQPEVKSVRAVFEASGDPGLTDPDFDVAIKNRRLLMVRGAGEQQIADRLEVALGLLPAAFPGS
jgi:hypothetical protein